ncbi:conserved hypothetical protein [Vibrio crassostreae]|nr:conserved hypothetical protein [Vibrio crassostreae]CAK2489255.1 conserved hypothetical protein [Vibrio crassostreae]CAK3581670.1 conserved hypothetical protein [Vibrio crassostreae]
MMKKYLPLVLVTLATMAAANRIQPVRNIVNPIV